MRLGLYLIISLFLASCSSTNKTTGSSSTNDPFNFKPVENCAGEISKPQVLNASEARQLGGYPEELRRNRVEGTVIMSFGVNKLGNVHSVTTLSSPDNRLTSISERVLKAYTFKPGTCDSVAVAFMGSARNSYRLSR